MSGHGHVRPNANGSKARCGGPSLCSTCKKEAGLPTKDAITASGFLTSEQIGDKQSITPNGFLLCQEVPVARTGIQEYASIELPDIEDKDGIVEVERDEDVVFSPETIASFEGAPVTLDHPSDPVTPENWAILAKGTTHNVRRGEGSQSNLLIADLLITDKSAINEIRNNGLREISCGYDSEYQQIAPGRARQVNIVGNHVALVKNARCGPVCSISDSSNSSHGEKAMTLKKGAQSFADKMRKLFMARDSEGFEKALEEANDEGMGEGGVPHIHVHLPGAGEAAAAAAGGEQGNKGVQDDDPMAKVVESVNKLTEVVTGIAERVGKLEAAGAGGNGGGSTADNESEEEKKAREEKEKAAAAATSDSAALKDEFQDTKARAEILAPGINLPTYDAKADGKKTADGLCALRRRALTTALEGTNADLVKVVVGDADIAKLTCDSAKAFFNAASELVKRKNASVATAATTTTNDEQSSFAKINETNAAFWAKRT